jgi:hypothetical protein
MSFGFEKVKQSALGTPKERKLNLTGLQMDAPPLNTAEEERAVNQD